MNSVETLNIANLNFSFPFVCQYSPPAKTIGLRDMTSFSNHVKIETLHPKDTGPVKLITYCAANT
jgi:hypothetical protein